jgi:hypothetical protein
MGTGKRISDGNTRLAGIALASAIEGCAGLGYGGIGSRSRRHIVGSIYATPPVGADPNPANLGGDVFGRRLISPVEPWIDIPGGRFKSGVESWIRIDATVGAKEVPVALRGSFLALLFDVVR